MTKFKMIWLLVLLFLAVFSFCMLIVFQVQGAEIHGNVQVGYIKEVESFETEINVQFLPWRWWTIYGGINVLMEHGKGTHFYPYRSTYITGTKVSLTKMLFHHESDEPDINVYVDLYNHCVHPVWSYSGQFYDKFAGGNKSMISIGIEW